MIQWTDPRSSRPICRGPIEAEVEHPLKSRSVTRMAHHLVILRDVYFDPLLRGRKTIECRLSAIRRPPFEAVEPGDLLWFKSPSGPIRAVGWAGPCEFQALHSADDLGALLAPHLSAIHAQPGFFTGAERWARYLSLIRVDGVMAVSPYSVRKRDQRAWVTLRTPPIPSADIRTFDRRVTART